MKKAVLAVFLLLAPLVSANPEPRINVESINPSPVSPGEPVRVDLVVANDGTSPAEFGPVSTETVEGVRYTGTTSTLNKSFTLCGGCQQVGTLYFTTQNVLNSGSYPARIRIPVDDSTYFETATINVDGTATLTAVFPNTKIPLGGEENITLEIKNTGTDTASNTVLSFTSEKVAFSPSSVSLGTIEPGSATTKKFSVSIDESVGTGSRQVVGNIEYNEDSKRTESEVRGSVRVENIAELAIDNLEIDSPVVGEKTRLSIELENLGPGEAESITVEPECRGAIVSPTKTFIGQIDADESVPAVFDLTPTSRNLSCAVRAEYFDSSQRSIERTSGFTANNPPPVSPIIIVAVTALLLLLSGFFYLRRRRDELEEV